MLFHGQACFNKEADLGCTFYPCCDPSLVTRLDIRRGDRLGDYYRVGILANPSPAYHIIPINIFFFFIYFIVNFSLIIEIFRSIKIFVVVNIFPVCSVRQLWTQPVLLPVRGGHSTINLQLDWSRITIRGTRTTFFKKLPFLVCKTCPLSQGSGVRSSSGPYFLQWFLYVA